MCISYSYRAEMHTSACSWVTAWFLSFLTNVAWLCDYQKSNCSFFCSTSLREVLCEAGKLYDMWVGAQLKINSKSIIGSQSTWLIFTVAECMIYIYMYASARSDIRNNVIYWNDALWKSSMQQKNHVLSFFCRAAYCTCMQYVILQNQHMYIRSYI